MWLIYAVMVRLNRSKDFLSNKSRVVHKAATPRCKSVFVNVDGGGEIAITGLLAVGKN